MTLRKANSIFKDILRNRCDEVLIDQSRVLDGGAGMLREIRWRYGRHTFWVEYVHFEVPDRKANILLKGVIIPLKRKFKANDEGQWSAFTTMGEFFKWFGLWAMGE